MHRGLPPLIFKSVFYSVLPRLGVTGCKPYSHRFLLFRSLKFVTTSEKSFKGRYSISPYYSFLRHSIRAKGRIIIIPVT